MPLEFQEIKGNIVSVKASGKLTKEDYDQFVPRMEQLIEQWGRLRMLFQMDNCQGWDAHSSWDEFKFQLKHRKDLKRVAVVGDARWEKWASMVSRIFTGADVRYFDQDQAEEASTWIESGW
ncbi:MAG: STAS/SEC14 domain-containing protein [Planctomycetes bacterium]|nr:STAS/SEC14 domain-containing protein [Planctomycetota bacterium]